MYGCARMNDAFYRVLGIDPSDEATFVYVWCRTGDLADYTLVGSGHVVRGEALPPGITPGQFAVSILLPAGCSADSVVVTDDKNGDEHLSDVSVLPCSTPLGLRPEVVARFAEYSKRAGSARRS